MADRLESCVGPTRACPAAADDSSVGWGLMRPAGEVVAMVKLGLAVGSSVFLSGSLVDAMPRRH